MILELDNNDAKVGFAGEAVVLAGGEVIVFTSSKDFSTLDNISRLLGPYTALRMIASEAN